MSTDSALTISLGAGAIADYDGDALTAQLTVTAVTESIAASTASPLTEATLDESVVTLTLSGRTFEDSSFSLRRGVTVSGINGVTVGTFDVDRVSDTEVTVELTFDGTNFDTTSSLTLTVGAGAIAGYGGSRTYRTSVRQRRHRIIRRFNRGTINRGNPRWQRCYTDTHRPDL